MVNSTDKPKLVNKLVNRAFVSSLTSGTSVVMASDSLEIDGVGKEEGVNRATANGGPFSVKDKSGLDFRRENR